MASTIFVTGGTGQTGGNVCQQLIERGDHVRALVRNPDEATALADIGVELVKGDIRDVDDVLRAAEDAEAAIHCAALLGGASQDLEDFKAVNMVGTRNVLDAGKVHGMRRVVALSTATFLDLSTGVDFEEAPVLKHPPNDPYTVTKLAAFLEAHERAAAGDDVLTCHPGAIFGPAPVVQRALHRTSFNRVLLAGMRGKIKRYLAFPVTWVAGADVAKGSIAALESGVAGERYLLVGRPEDTFSTAGG
ncbi:MAG: NAD-dependent epimerase/dehydratase family protein, partial [Mycobacterium sp.]|uniref:NAD-dependent epimerase/dehydratase family protein n=1 Tax=Mycobacterium sp. TaxID=1785 RepID=UPI001EC705B2